MDDEVVHIEPIQTEWGEITITAHVATHHKKDAVRWDVTYPKHIPDTKKKEFEALVKIFMEKQEADLVRLFS